MSLQPARSGLGLALLLGALGATGGAPTPGAYCPFPTGDELPKCLQPAGEKYADFLEDAQRGELRDEEVARLESEVETGADAAERYEALSTIAYGYYLLARRASHGEDDAAARAWLERWNGVLGRAWTASEEDPRYREALEQAATDLRDRAPPVRLACLDAEGEPAQCDSTEAVLRTMNRAGERAGIRGALGRLLGRVFGTTEP